MAPELANAAELLAERDALFGGNPLLHAVLDAMPQMVWSTLPDGFHDYFNSRWYAFTGALEGSTDGEGWAAMVQPDDRDKAWERWRHSLKTGEPYAVEYRLHHRSGEYRWAAARATALRSPDGEIVRWIGTCTDIDAAKRQAEHNEILSRELSHRIKNIFAVISGLIGLSSRREPSAKDFAKALQDRIASLGRAHEFVRPHSEQSMPNVGPSTLHTMIRDILSPYPALAEGRLIISGDDVAIDDRGATPIALVFHELATNATKYGALSDLTGRIAVETRLAGDVLSISWAESGGPRISGPPSSSGFGAKLAELSVVQQLGGNIARDWAEGGLRVTIELQPARLVRSLAK